MKALGFIIALPIFFTAVAQEREVLVLYSGVRSGIDRDALVEYMQNEWSFLEEAGIKATFKKRFRRESWSYAQRSDHDDGWDTTAFFRRQHHRGLDETAVNEGVCAVDISFSDSCYRAMSFSTVHPRSRFVGQIGATVSLVKEDGGSVKITSGTAPSASDISEPSCLNNIQAAEDAAASSLEGWRKEKILTTLERECFSWRLSAEELRDLETRELRVAVRELTERVETLEGQGW